MQDMYSYYLEWLRIATHWPLSVMNGSSLSYLQFDLDSFSPLGPLSIFYDCSQDHRNSYSQYLPI